MRKMPEAVATDLEERQRWIQEFVHFADRALEDRGRSSGRLANFWWAAGAFALAVGVASSVLVALYGQGLTKGGSTASIGAGAIAGAGTFAIAKYCFDLGKVHGKEAAVCKDLYYGIRFGLLCFELFGGNATYAEVKSFFHDSPLSVSGNVDKLNMRDYDPRLMSNLGDTLKAKIPGRRRTRAARPSNQNPASETDAP